MKSGDGPIFWIIFSVGMTVGLLYSVDRMTGSNLVEITWRRVLNLW